MLTLEGRHGEALQTFEIAVSGYREQGSGLEIERIEARAWCDRCGREQTLPSFRMRCPLCQQPVSRVVAGRELEILSVEMVDHEPAGVR